MNEEYIYVKTNDVQKDMHDFVSQFGNEIAYISYPKNIIRLKNDIIYRFTYTLVGIRKYYSYTEVCNYHLKFQNKNLQQENQKLKDNWNKLKEFIVKEYYMYLPLEATTKSITILIDKMQELEKSDKQ